MTRAISDAWSLRTLEQWCHSYAQALVTRLTVDMCGDGRADLGTGASLAELPCDAVVEDLLTDCAEVEFAARDLFKDLADEPRKVST